jgi:hypothetical protein
LETRSANSRSPKTEDPTSWKSCPKNFQVWVWKPTLCTSQNWNLTSWKSCP